MIEKNIRQTGDDALRHRALALHRSGGSGHRSVAITSIGGAFATM